MEPMLGLLCRRPGPPSPCRAGDVSLSTCPSLTQTETLAWVMRFPTGQRGFAGLLPKAQVPVLSHHSQGLPDPGPAGGRTFQGAVAPQAPRHSLDSLPRRDPMCPLPSPHLHDAASSLGPGFGPAVHWTCLEGRSGRGGECPGGSNDQGHRFSLGGALDLESKVALVILWPCPSRAVDSFHSNSALPSEPVQVPEPLLRCPSTWGTASSEPSGQTWPSVPRFPRGPPRGLGVCAPPGQ